jgi:hypothetical protein
VSGETTMKFTRVSLALLIFAMAGCSNHRTPPAGLLNTEASPPSGLPYAPLEWRVIASTVDNRDSTMSTLFGNDAAVSYARTSSQYSYPPGAMLAVVCWYQQNDPHWFGGKIPGRVKSIEFVGVDSTSNQPPSYTYEKFAGASMKKSPVQPTIVTKARVDQLLKQQPSVMP